MSNATLLHIASIYLAAINVVTFYAYARGSSRVYYSSSTTGISTDAYGLVRAIVFYVNSHMS